MSSPIRRALRALRADLHIHSQEASPRRRFAVLLRRVAKYGLAAVFYYSGLTGRLLRRCLVSRDGALILGYHGISTKGPDPFSSNQNLEFLEDQLRFLKHHLRPVRLEEISQPVARGESPPAGAFALTFDDGLVNNVLLAVPLLEELDLPATFFVPSGLVGSHQDLWIASLREIIRAWPDPVLQAEPPLWPELRVDDEQSRFRAFFRVKAALKAHGEPRKAVLDSLARRAGGYLRPPEEDRVVGAEMLHRMTQRGLSVGAHTRTHPILSELGGERARLEIEGSRLELEALLARPVLDFAYPNGRFHDFDESTCRLVLEAGYRCAVTTEPGTVRRGDDRLALRRCLPDNVPVFLASFDLLIPAWRDGFRPGDLAQPLARRRSYLRTSDARIAA